MKDPGLSECVEEEQLRKVLHVVMILLMIALAIWIVKEVYL